MRNNYQVNKPNEDTNGLTKERRGHAIDYFPDGLIQADLPSTNKTLSLVMCGLFFLLIAGVMVLCRRHVEVP